MLGDANSVGSRECRELLHQAVEPFVLTSARFLVDLQESCGARLPWGPRTYRPVAPYPTTLRSCRLFRLQLVDGRQRHHFTSLTIVNNNSLSSKA